MIHDNNLTSGDFEHFKEVMNYLRKNELTCIFDNGFDCRFFDDDHLFYIKFDRCSYMDINVINKAKVKILNRFRKEIVLL